jgi:hypothetical protein
LRQRAHTRRLRDRERRALSELAAIASEELHRR